MHFFLLLQMTDMNIFSRYKESISNFEAYNREAREILERSRVVIWDSTVPLSRAYVFQCYSQEKTTSMTFWWKCLDRLHVGYIVVEQYTDMLLNDVCNKYMSLPHDYC